MVVLEVLHAGPALVEADWGRLADVIAGLAATGVVRLAVLHAAVAAELHVQTRARLDRTARGTARVVAELISWSLGDR